MHSGEKCKIQSGSVQWRSISSFSLPLKLLLSALLYSANYILSAHYSLLTTHYSQLTAQQPAQRQQQQGKCYFTHIFLPHNLRTLLKRTALPPSHFLNFSEATTSGQAPTQVPQLENYQNVAMQC